MSGIGKPERATFFGDPESPQVRNLTRVVHPRANLMPYRVIKCHVLGLAYRCGVRKMGCCISLSSTKLYDRTNDQIALDQVEKIVIQMQMRQPQC